MLIGDTLELKALNIGVISEKYKECAIGKQQSPINLITTKAVKGSEADK